MSKTSIKKVLRRIGLASLAGPSRKQLLRNPLVQMDIHLLLDVGANTGQYAMEAREKGYRGRIISFEPLPDEHAALACNAERDPLWQVHPRAAVGAVSGLATVNVANNSGSSSLLPMLPAHTAAAPQSQYVRTVETPVIRLDCVIDNFVAKNERTFLKIDTQGYEAQVLSGLGDRISVLTGLQIELSVVPLYEGQQLYTYFLNLLAEEGFVLWSLIPGLRDPNNGRLLQFDAVFWRDPDLALRFNDVSASTI
jgi:FkbM family methyltransferase